eukprot:TRINITY_DN571_c1_g1_i2.p1 TRINITY_DN571_c1_g1~~TRINITY_DN571_c1_g1_i2.p1  ORF type:complete len:1478 (-),score=440.54 TRINITY_DN571_c1_g1_i2:1064-5116(-)
MDTEEADEEDVAKLHELIVSSGESPSESESESEDQEEEEEEDEEEEEGSDSEEKEKEEKVKKRSPFKTLSFEAFAELARGRGGSGGGVQPNISSIALMYTKECKSAFESLRKSVQVLTATRRELARYMAKNKAQHTEPMVRGGGGHCYGCSTSFVGSYLRLLQRLGRNSPDLRKRLVAEGALPELIRRDLRAGSPAVRRDARRLVCLLCEGSVEATDVLIDLVRERVSFAIDNYQTADVASLVRNEMELLEEACCGGAPGEAAPSEIDKSGAVQVQQSDDVCWEKRLRLVMQLLLQSTKASAESPLVSEHITLPCLRILVAILVPKSDEQQKKKHKKHAKGSDEVKTGKEAKSGTVPEKEARSSPLISWGPSVDFAAWTEGRVSFKGWSAGYILWLEAAHKADSTQAREQYLAEKFGRRWINQTVGRKHPRPFVTTGARLFGNTEDFDGAQGGASSDEKWLQQLLLCPCSETIRAQSARLVRALYENNPARALHFVDLLAVLLPRAVALRETAYQFFELFFELIETEDTRLYLAVKGFLPFLFRLIHSEVGRLKGMEDTITTDIAQGATLKHLVNILTSMVKIPTVRKKFKSLNLLNSILDTFLDLRGLVLQKTKQTDDCSDELLAVLTSLNETDADHHEFLRACVKGLVKYRESRAVIFIYEQLCSIVSPEQREPEYMMILNKTPSQDEFIRGTMTKNPYSSREVGPLMRQVKNKICETLDLRGLIEDDNGMELLVCNKIIKLDLSIRQVYEKVWAAQDGGKGAGTPMVVVYRLQGLDGEATEEIVDSLPAITSTAEKSAEQIEEEFKQTRTIVDCGGLAAMLRTLAKQGTASAATLRESGERWRLVLKLLGLCCKLKVNRRSMVAMNGVQVVASQLDALLSCVAAARDSAKEEKDKGDATAAAAVSRAMLLVINSLSGDDVGTFVSAGEMDVDTPQPQPQPQLQSFTAEQREEHRRQLFSILEKLHFGLVRNNKDLLQDLLRALPVLTYGREDLMDDLIGYFTKFTDFSAYDRRDRVPDEDPQAQVLACLIGLLEAAVPACAAKTTDDTPHPPPLRSCGALLAARLLELGVTSALVTYITERFRIDLDDNMLATNLALRSVPVALRCVAALAKSHEASQALLHKAGLLPVLQHLQSVNHEADIHKAGVLAAALLDSLSDCSCPAVRNTVAGMRKSARREKLKQAAARRQQILGQMGLNVDGSKITLAATPGSVEQLGEEESIACMVCREGLSFKPQEVLGFYTNSRVLPFAPPPTPLQLLASGPLAALSASGRSQQQLLGLITSLGVPKSEMGYSTTTHFNTIHFSCATLEHTHHPPTHTGATSTRREPSARKRRPKRSGRAPRCATK